MSDEFSIKLTNKTTHTWRLPRSHHANFGVFEIRPNSELEFELQPFSQTIYGAYKSIELSMDSNQFFVVKTKKRKGWKMEKQPDKFYIRLLNSGGQLIESILLNQDEENVRLPLGIEFELEIDPFSRSIFFESIEIKDESETRVKEQDPGFGPYRSIYHQCIVRKPRSEEEMSEVRRARTKYHEKRLNRAFDKAADNVA